MNNYRGTSTDSQELPFLAIGELPVSIKEWRVWTRNLLKKEIFDYLEGGAGSEYTIISNRKAFKRWYIQPRFMRDVTNRNLTVTLFGEKHSPFLLAPIGAQTIFHKGGEILSAKAAASTKTPFIVSNVSSYTIEEIANVMGNSPRWFQLYIGKDWDVTASLVNRVEKAGYSALVVTIDLPLYGWRERDFRNNYIPYTQGIGLVNYTSDPVFMSKLLKHSVDDPSGRFKYFLINLINPGLTWDDLTTLKKLTRLPIILKGILHPEDAELALKYGANGLIVSNHGGRQVDGAIASLDALPRINQVVNGEIPILLDSGIRGGSDVIKALSLGATAVLIGRPYIYGLAVAGELGVHRVISNLMTDLDLSMANIGQTDVNELNTSLLLKCSN